MMTMSKLLALKLSTSRADLADLLETELKNLTYICYGLSDKVKYSTFSIDKKSGGKREITAPELPLKTIQKKLANLLQSCYNEITDINASPSHGYVKGKSIITNALSHKKQRFVINLDLEDFFKTITFPRIFGFLTKNNHFKLNKEVASTIAHLACYNGYLAQGAPSSPIISNLISNILDVRLSTFAKKNNCRYSRYVDDITFSTREKCIPNSIATLQEEKYTLSSSLEKEIQKCGFRVNKNKTRISFHTAQQEVTGLVVNKKLSIKSTYWRNIRAMVHNLCENGEFIINDDVGQINQLRGMLGFINQIDLKNSINRNKEHGLNQRERTYSKFLYYVRFYCNEHPTILCEGKTDHIYLHSALKNLHLDFPKLITKKPDDTFELSVDFYKYKHTESLLLGLSGGSDILRYFIQSYPSNIKKYKAPSSKMPIIIFIDNDEGAKKIYSLIKETTKSSKPITGNEAYYKLFDKLYIVPTPKIAGADSMIEDFFPDSVLNSILGGKTFEPDESKHNPAKNYSKAIFSEKIIAPNYSSIDFSNFKPFIKTISDIIENHK